MRSPDSSANIYLMLQGWLVIVARIGLVTPKTHDTDHKNRATLEKNRSLDEVKGGFSPTLHLNIETITYQ